MAELKRLGLLGSARVIDGAVQRERQAYPLYDVDYRDHIRIVRDFLARFRNLSLAGRNGMHRYVNQDLAMASAMEATAEILGTASAYPSPNLTSEREGAVSPPPSSRS